MSDVNPEGGAGSGDALAEGGSAGLSASPAAAQPLGLAAVPGAAQPLGLVAVPAAAQPLGLADLPAAAQPLDPVALPAAAQPLAAPQAAPQPPPLAAVLQQVLVSSQAVAAGHQSILARLDALEHAQGQPHPPGPQNLPVGAQPIAAQPAGLAHAAAQLPPWAPGALGIQLPQGPVDPSQAAAAAAVIKANARVAAELWRALAGAKLFLARGSFSVAVELSPELLRFILKKVAGVSAAVAKQLQCLSGFAAEDFFPPAPTGETPEQMPAEVHFGTFIAALMAVLEYGMGGAPAICKARVATLKNALEAVHVLVLGYLQFHYMILSPFPSLVREELLAAINAGLDECMHAIAGQAGILGQAHPSGPPPSGSGEPVATPQFTRLRALLEEGSTNSLASRTLIWGQTRAKAAGPRGDKRKTAARAGGSKATPKQGEPTPGDGNRAFKARLVAWDTPAGVCEYAWRGMSCNRVSCSFAHDQVSPAARAAPPAPQGATPPPHLAPPPPQQQQAASTAGSSGAPSGGAGRTLPAVRFSRSYAGGGRGGAPPGSGSGRGGGASNN